jgi:glycosyltransferase involved in cell wall biosynthesis
MIKGQQILCISTQDWNDLWTRKHRFMQRLARQGNKVIYIEAPASLASLNIIKNDPLRIFRWLKGPRRIEKNLYVATLPLLLPFFQMSVFINGINSWGIKFLLKLWARKLGFKKFILWSYTPFSDNIAKKMGEKFTIYECVDEFTDSKGLVRAGVVKKMEERLLKKADLVIVTHENLLRSKKAFNRDIHVISNGAEVEHFKKAALSETLPAEEMSRIRPPIIGFLGSVQYWLDFDLIRDIAVLRPSWSIVLIGPVGRLAKIEKISGLSNIHILGKRVYGVLPSYIRAWDVCINPYILNKTAENCSPLKLYEYLATGKPIVSVDMPEARKFERIIGIAGGAEDFVRHLDGIIASLPEDPAKIQERINSVENHSWDHRFKELEAVLEPRIKS